MRNLANWGRIAARRRRGLRCGIGTLLGGALIAGLACGSVGGHRAAAAEVNRIGRTIEPFALPDVYGKTRSLGEFADAKLVVVVFLGVDCPLVKLYAPRIEELADEYGSKGVAFIGINSNRQDSSTQIANFGRRNNLSFPLLKDRDNTVADQFAAVRTPEAFVLDKN
ncbi:MAG: redoxin domain-containing protein, partial [Planctomycetaceae bacterium]|nr:redoxin domain-containing protein [Planctomycetaceae bacterium]